MICNMMFSVLIWGLMSMGVLTVNAQDTLMLEANTIQLKEVVVSKEKPKKITLGTKAFTPLMWLSVSTRAETCAEHGKLIQIKKPSRLLTANVRVAGNKKSKDSVTYRLNIYKIKNGFPAERIPQTEIIKTFPCTADLLTIDLFAENIYLHEDSVVAFEYLPNKGRKGRFISFRANIIENDAFFRKLPSDTWAAMKSGSPAIFVEVAQ